MGLLFNVTPVTPPEVAEVAKKMGRLEEEVATLRRELDNWEHCSAHALRCRADEREEQERWDKEVRETELVRVGRKVSFLNVTAVVVRVNKTDAVLAYNPPRDIGHVQYDTISVELLKELETAY